MHLRDHIRDIPDHPKPGITFRDITPLLQNPDAFSSAITEMHDLWSHRVDAIAALDARGFLFGTPLARELGLPFVPIRKKGKLPFSTIAVTYDLEYGTDTIEMHTDALEPGTRVLIVDDVLATGGTAAAAKQLIEKVGAKVAGYAFLMEIAFLNGRAKLGNHPIQSLITYE